MGNITKAEQKNVWFQKACRDPDGRYGKYFYIVDRDSSGKLPCNLRSVFGGSVWEPLPGHPDKLYLHTFHKKQPDLNWENPKVREEIYRNALWWMDRGIAGFRIDAITYIKKDLPFLDAPVDREDGLCYIGRSPESVQGLGVFLREFRDRVFAPRKALTIGEVFNEQEDELEVLIGENGYFSSMFDFSHIAFGQKRLGWYSWDPITTEEYKQCVIDAQRRIGRIGYFSNVIENHDRPRAANRYLPLEGRTEAGKKCLALAYFMLRGIPFIYQGQEIGMENFPFQSFEEFDDIIAIDEYRVALDAGFGEEKALETAAAFYRDNARTPMQWDETESAGFTSGTPWYRVNPGYQSINVRKQEERPDSLLNFYRSMAGLRKAPEYFNTLAYGDFESAFEERKSLFAYYRKGEKDLLILANLKTEEETVPISLPYRILLKTTDACRTKKDLITLEGWQGIVVELL
ncbi:MAG: DUF3459 domain-containing protein [Lachnospiraceae bacterium]|nr:DUF3459 domain-containing protein [Lachnospiraceae bacterium]